MPNSSIPPPPPAWAQRAQANAPLGDYLLKTGQVVAREIPWVGDGGAGSTVFVDKANGTPLSGHTVLTREYPHEMQKFDPHSLPRGARVAAALGKTHEGQSLLNNAAASLGRNVVRVMPWMQAAQLVTQALVAIDPTVNAEHAAEVKHAADNWRNPAVRQAAAQDPLFLYDVNKELARRDKEGA
ncbi:MAG: hypothetical protein ACKVPX_06115 [Myxococcaceae bacterium]